MAGLILSHFSAYPISGIDLDHRYNQSTAMNRKPDGLWLSDESEGQFGWKDYCESISGSWTLARISNRMEVRVTDMSKVLHLMSYSDVVSFNREYVQPDQNINWTRVANEYDGILITPYERGTMWDDDLRWYEYWSVASGCFWNLNILERVEDESFEPHRIGAEDHLRSVQGPQILLPSEV